MQYARTQVIYHLTDYRFLFGSRIKILWCGALLLIISNCELFKWPWMLLYSGIHIQAYTRNTNINVKIQAPIKNHTSVLKTWIPIQAVKNMLIRNHILTHDLTNAWLKTELMSMNECFRKNECIFIQAELRLIFFFRSRWSGSTNFKNLDPHPWYLQ